MNVIDLDANATTPVLPEAWEAMRAAADAHGNPSSAHAIGRAARRHLEDARDRVAELLGATAEEVIFTSGATEANNLALFGLSPSPPEVRGGIGGRPHPPAPSPSRRWGVQGVNVTTVSAQAFPGTDSARPEPERVGHPLSGTERGPGGEVFQTQILAAPIEHPCVIGPLKELEKRGVGVEWLPVTEAGAVEQKAVLDRVTVDTRLVTLMMVNHEVGTIQPIRHVAKTLPKHVLLHTDAAQAVGKVPVNFRDLGVTALTASAHKFRGPKGVGLLLLKKGTKLLPQMHGGHQQRGHRPGTEPVPLAVGLATALDFALKNLAENVARVTAARDAFLLTIRASRLFFVVNTPEEAVPHAVNLSFPGCRSELLLMALDLAGVACSTGSACSSGSLLPSPVLKAMGVPTDVLESAMRFSFGTTLAEADATDAARRVVDCVRRMRGQDVPGGGRGGE